MHPSKQNNLNPTQNLNILKKLLNILQKKVDLALN